MPDILLQTGITTAIVMLLIGGLLVLAQGSALAPFIYTIF